MKDEYERQMRLRFKYEELLDKIMLSLLGLVASCAIPVVIGIALSSSYDVRLTILTFYGIFALFCVAVLLISIPTLEARWSKEAGVQK